MFASTTKRRDQDTDSNVLNTIVLESVDHGNKAWAVVQTGFVQSMSLSEDWKQSLQRSHAGSCT
jgi:hypothetical protein